MKKDVLKELETKILDAFDHKCVKCDCFRNISICGRYKKQGFGIYIEPKVLCEQCYYELNIKQ